MFLEGVILMFAGMGAVVLFLALLVIVTNKSSTLIRALEAKMNQTKAE
ncbi:MAG: OadG family protein [Mailhella sp.]|jgi:Na+-transporting methylmalonyl-CoA/oxaloacetate decarboxylase gamma subunit|nr:OadG family protein [Mailhella sp.]